MENDKLTYKEKRFVDFYVTTARFNATVAHEMAGYKAKNKETRWVLASRLLSKAKVKAAIDDVLNKEHENNAVLKTEIRRFYEAILRADYNKIVKFRVTSATDGESNKIESHIYQVPDLNVLDEDLRVAVKLIRKTANGFTLELYSKMDAAAELRKMYGFDKPVKHEIAGKDGGPLQIIIEPPKKTNE